MSVQLSKSQFRRIARIAHELWGLSLSDRKLELVANRLSRYMLRSRFKTVEEVLDNIENNPSKEDLLAFFDVLSTNTTKFFRDTAHFAYIEREFFTGLANGTLTVPNRRVRIWSAACSTGCEPCSLAMLALETIPDLERWDFRILATDLSLRALEQARAGIFPAQQVEELSKQRQRRFFERVDAQRYRIRPEVMDLISYRRLNLMEPWPFRGPFQVIFCCNVMIYFDEHTREKLVNRFYDILPSGGILAIGSAETLSGLETPFVSVQANMYRK